MIGFWDVGHLMVGSFCIFFHMLFVTNSFMLPSALCLKMVSVYMCQLFFHPFVGSGRLSCSRMIFVFSFVLALIAFSMVDSRAFAV